MKRDCFGKVSSIEKLFSSFFRSTWNIDGFEGVLSFVCCHFYRELFEN